MWGREIVAFGNFGRDEEETLERIAENAALGLSMATTRQRAEALVDQNPPCIFFVSAEHPETPQLCQTLRSEVKTALLPIISLTQRKPTGLSFEEVFSWGGDDTVPLTESRALLARVRSLPRRTMAPPPERGVALIADPDRTRRVVRARVLRSAGFEVRFAVRHKDALTETNDPQVRLVVADEELEDAFEIVSKSAKSNPSTAHIFLTTPRNLSGFCKAFLSLPNADAADGFAPPENIVFLGNELIRGDASDQRASRRLLYGTRVLFRGEGQEAVDAGYTYNISANGLYIRTLAPPPEDPIVWLELTPPRANKRVFLEAEVVWRRPFGPSKHATVPPGFGVRIVDATQKNKAAWLLGYRTFSDVLGFSVAAPAVASR